MFQPLKKYVSPKIFYERTHIIAHIAVIGGWLLFITGMVWGLAFTPPDYQQGDGFRIIYIHVPAAFLSLFVYVVMTGCVISGLVWRVKLSFMMAKCCAPAGALFTFLALVTGAIWGKPMWGDWWVWDARLTSELILIFIYFGIIALHRAYDNVDTGDKAGAILILVGFVNIPIIHFSVKLGNTLHQGATISKFDTPSMAFSMLWPLTIMIIAQFALFFFYIIMQTRNEILYRERHKQWVRDCI